MQNKRLATVAAVVSLLLLCLACSWVFSNFKAAGEDQVVEASSSSFLDNRDVEPSSASLKIALEKLRAQYSEIAKERDALKEELEGKLAEGQSEGSDAVLPLAPERVWEMGNATADWKYREFGPQCSKKLHVVYFAYIPEDPALGQRWRGIIGQQLADLAEESRGLHGLLTQSCLHVSISFPSGNNTQANEAVLLIRQVLPDFVSLNITLVPKNLFEYPGILRLWQLSMRCPDCIIGYFHSKGMAFHANVTARFWVEAVLTRAVILDWKFAIDILKTREDVNKVGVLCAREAFAWNNFFWIRASYAAKLGPPYVTHPRGRWYFERWAAPSIDWPRDIPQPRDCYSLSYETANEIRRSLETMRKWIWTYHRDIMRHPRCPSVSDGWNPNSDPEHKVHRGI